MKFYKRIFLVPVFCAALMQCNTRPSTVDAEKSDTAKVSSEIIGIEQKLMDDLATGDTTSWSSHLAKNFFIVTEDGSRMSRKEFLSDIRPLPAGYIGHIKVIKPQFSFLQNTVVINYVADEYLNLMGQQLHTTYSVSNTYLNSEG